MKISHYIALSLGALFIISVIIIALLKVGNTKQLDSGTTRHVPRFVTLRSDNIKMRVGPGREYPIACVLKRKGLPVKIIAEYDTWRQIECHDGTTGWIHQGLLSGRRNLFVIKGSSKLWDSQDRNAKPILRLKSTILLDFNKQKCTATHCRVKIQGYSGWVEKRDVWGLLEQE
jgi:SH3-like domain-containing protein